MKIFISYRRDDSADISGRIYDRLTTKYGRDDVFKDVDAIPFGMDFRKVLDNEVKQCDVLLAVIGRDWLNIKDKDGKRRLESITDFVRIEIESALQRGIPVIPLFVRGASGLPADQLPESLRDLAFMNGIPVRRDPDFHKDIDRLIGGLPKALKETQEERERLAKKKAEEDRKAKQKAKQEAEQEVVNKAEEERKAKQKAKQDANNKIEVARIAKQKADAAAKKKIQVETEHKASQQARAQQVESIKNWLSSIPKVIWWVGLFLFVYLVFFTQNASDECADDLGCVTYANGAPIRIASALAISGPIANLGLDSQYGVEIAIQFKGDIRGHFVELQAEDDGCSTEGGQVAGQKITSDPTIIAVIGTSCTAAGVSMSELVSEAGYLMVSPSNVSPILTDPNKAWSEGYYRTGYNDKLQGAVIAEYAYNVLGAITAAAIHDGDPYTESIASAFRKSFEELGGEIIEYIALNVGDNDMRPVLNTIAAAGSPDFIYFPVFTYECAFLSNQAGEVAGLEDTILAAADGCISDDALEVMGEASAGMFFSSVSFAFENSRYDVFLDAYYANYDVDSTLSTFHAHAFDAATIVLNCVEEVAQEGDDGSLIVGRQAMRDCVGSTSAYEGITGTLTCDEYGDCADPKITVSEVKDGEYVPIWP